MTSDFRRQAASALLHPVTLAALAVLVVNDFLFKAIWPGAWIPGKLSDLAWMIFAPPALAYILSFGTVGNLWTQRVAFATAYAGLPLLYAAFNTFGPVHDAVLSGLGIFGGAGPRSPLDASDSLVIPFAMIVAAWVWYKPVLQGKGARDRLALLAAMATAFASIASAYPIDRGVTDVGRTGAGTLGANAPFSGGAYESVDGGLTWTKVDEHYVVLEEKLRASQTGFIYGDLNVVTPSGDVFIADRTHSQIIRERSELLSSQEGSRDALSVSRGPDGRLTAYGASANREVVYSYAYLQNRGNLWMQGVDKRAIETTENATRVYDLFYDDQNGNLIAAFGIQGVVVIAPDGTITRVAVGRYSPTNFSFWGKVGALFGSLLDGPAVISTGVALLLAFTAAALALVAPGAPRGEGWFLVACMFSAFLAVTAGVYPQEISVHAEDGYGTLIVILYLFPYGFPVSSVIAGLIPLSLVLAGFAVNRTNLRQVRDVGVASIGMLSLIALGALVLFETGAMIANFVAVGLVGLATVGVRVYLWARKKRSQM